MPPAGVFSEGSLRAPRGHPGNRMPRGARTRSRGPRGPSPRQVVWGVLCGEAVGSISERCPPSRRRVLVSLLLVGRTDCGDTPGGKYDETTTTKTVTTTPKSLVPLVALRLGGVRTITTMTHSMRVRPHLGCQAQGPLSPNGDRSIASYIRSLLCARWTPESRSRSSGDRGRFATPGSAHRLEAGVILRDNSWRILRSASPCLGEPTISISEHCDIVHRGSDFKGAGCVTRPASEISLGESCPTHLGCMLGLMSAKQIRQNLRSPF